MIIRRIALRDFRRFASFEADFVPGFNLILGNNEEGKSTLREAIALALFQDPKTTDRRVLANKRWGANEQFAVELEIESEGKAYRLAKDFQAKTVLLGEGAIGEQLRDVRAVEERIKDCLGLPSRAFFDSTVRITQRDVTLIRNGQDIADSLQRLLTGGEQDAHASGVLDDLDSEIAGLKSTGRVSPGPLHALPLLISQKEARAAERTAALDRAETAEAALRENRTRLASEQQEFALKKKMQQDCAERYRLEDDLRRADDEHNALQAKIAEVRKLEEGIGAEEANASQDQAILALSPEQIEEFAVLDHKVSISVDKRDRREVRPRAAAAYVAAAGGLLLLIGIVASAIWLAAIGAGIVILALVLLSAGRNQGEILAREQREAAEQARRRLSQLLASVGCASAAEFRAKRKAAGERQHSLDRERARLEGLLAGETGDDVERRRQAASKAAREIRDRLAEPAMRLAALDQLGYQRLCQEVAALQESARALGDEIDDLQVTVRASRVDVDEVYSLQEEIEELRVRLAAAKKREAILALTRRVLADARAATLVSARDILEERLGEYAGLITRGRYPRVRVDDRLDIHLLSAERDEPIEVGLDGTLSTGTVEQLYLAARLALARLLAGDRRPPLILDDPFVTYDAPRTAEVLALCKRLSAENQVLLFSCRQEYQGLAEHVVRLPAVG